MATTAELLDLEVVVTRAEKVRFDLVDRHDVLLGEIHPQATAQISNDASQQIKRRLSNVMITADEYADINPLSDRVKPYWVLENDDELPLGVFLFADTASQRYTYGQTMTATLVDQGLVLTQELGATLGFTSGTTASEAITQTINAAGIYDADIGSSQFTLSSPNAYEAGRAGTTYSKVLEELCLKAGYHSPYFSNDGTLIIREATNLSTATASYDYIDGGRIIAGTIVESNDLLNAPNRFLVIDTAATTGAVAYEYLIPETAPHSYESRGFYITKTVEAPGVGNVEQARSVAEAHYQQTPQAYETVGFLSPADPRHDTFDVVNYRGTNYLEIGWTLNLAPGGPMTHRATRVYL
jgi:hypothetical protein